MSLRSTWPSRYWSCSVRLDQRLRLLRTRAALPPPASEHGELAARLRRLSSAPCRQAPRKTPDEQALAAALGADRLAPGVLRVRQRLDLDIRQGRVRLGDCLSALPGLLGEPAPHPNGWLFLDTETSGLAGGTGTWAFLCGLLRLEPDGLVVTQYLLTRLDAERPYLEALGTELRTAGLLVTYNGKSFDLPLLATRFRLAGCPSAFEDKHHLDLLHPMRRAFARMWPDCRLATAEQRLLDLAREDDLSGAEAPSAWLDWLRRGESEGLVAVLRHNRCDLLSLPALTRPLHQTLVDPAGIGADIQRIAQLHRSRGDPDLALELLSTNRDRLKPAALLDLARLHRRRGDWSSASDIWEALAEQRIPDALAEQAKYLEHRERDYAKALECVARLPPGLERENRRMRLEKKLWGQTPCPRS